MDEFGLIARYFAPLSRGIPGSLNLTDDAALLAPPHGHELVITKDAIVQGVHFIGNEEAGLIAQKLLRVNLSDLAGKGAAPIGYLLAMALPRDTDESWVAGFAEGLSKDQKEFGIYLLGGDTTASNTGMFFSLTAIGSVKTGTAMLRSGAKAGDDVYVSGTLGDSALGLLSLRAQQSNPDWIASSALPPRNDDFLIHRYQLPQPRVTLGKALIGIASAAMDISDGLLQDLGHLCRTSNAGATLHRPLLPLSAEAREVVEKQPDLWESVYAGGDDYEILFTAPPSRADAIARLGFPVTKIGEITGEKKVVLLDESGAAVPVTKTGFKHF